MPRGSSSVGTAAAAKTTPRDRDAGLDPMTTPAPRRPIARTSRVAERREMRALPESSAGSATIDTGIPSAVAPVAGTAETTPAPVAATATVTTDSSQALGNTPAALLNTLSRLLSNVLSDSAGKWLSGAMLLARRNPAAASPTSSSTTATLVAGGDAAGVRAAAATPVVAGSSATLSAGYLTIRSGVGANIELRVSGQISQLAVVDIGAKLTLGTWLLSSVSQVTYTGSSGNDTFNGSAVSKPLFINGIDGNDTLTGGSGRDTIYGGAGADVIRGGAGVDNIFGGTENDTIYGGSEDDVINGDAGNDVLRGDTGNDTIRGGEGNDTVNGGEGNDSVSGDANNDFLYGDGGNDRIFDLSGDDTLAGGDGDDWLEDSGVGRNTLLGGRGLDTIISGDGNDTIRGNEDADNIQAGGGADTVFGDAGVDTIRGGAGDDTVYGGDGDDLLYGDANNDAIYGDAGNDTADGGAGNDRVNGDADNDRLQGGDGDDTVSGGTGVDFLLGGAGADTVRGDAGNDTVNGGIGMDSLYGGDGDDWLVGIDNVGLDFLYGDAGRDIFWRDLGVGNADPDYLSQYVAADDVDNAVTQFANGVDRTLDGDRITGPSYPAGLALVDYSARPLFSTAGPKGSDINQGQVSDCKVVSGLAALARDNGPGDSWAIRRAMVDFGDGTYGVRLGNVFYRVDSRLPAQASGAPNYANYGPQNSIWVAVAEKAIAMASPLQAGVFNYADLASIGADTVFSLFGSASTGVPFLNANTLDPAAGLKPYATAAQLGADLINRFNTQQQYLTVSLTNSANGALGRKFVVRHAYTVWNLVTSGGQVTAVILRNPWGTDIGQFAVSYADANPNDAFVQVTLAELFSSMGRLNWGTRVF